MSEIQYQNRILLRKMIQIDLKTPGHRTRPGAIPAGPETLNRAVRNKEIVRVAEANHSFLDRLQKTTSHYSAVGWERNFEKLQKNTHRISENANRFSKNPYFLHSVTSTEINPYNQHDVTLTRVQSHKRGMSAKP